jgi:hypothetical protein
VVAGRGGCGSPPLPRSGRGSRSQARGEGPRREESLGW